MNIEDKLEKKIDKLFDKVASIDSTLAAQHESLKEHIRRTELLETRIEPIEKHVIVMNSLRKLLTTAVVSISLVTGMIKIITLLGK